MFRLLMVCGCALLLQGCVTPQEQAKEDDEICLGYGLQRGTQQYVDCRRFILDDRRARVESANRLRGIQSMSDALVKASEKSRPKPAPQKCRFERQPNGWDTRVCN